MDTVIEGKITAEESMSDIIQTVIDLKNLPNAILRITSTDTDLQGRIAFAQGGYILGGRVNNTEETGYSAVRKLLSVRNGNYAILDPGRQYMSDVNQTLWINASKVISMLPQLPDSPEVLIEAKMESLNPNAGKPSFDPLDLKVSASNIKAVPNVVANTKSRARQFNLSSWRTFRGALVIVVAMAIGAAVAKYWDQIIALVPH